MKITKIENSTNYSDTYIVTFKPNKLEKLFGYKDKTKEFKATRCSYMFGNQNCYITKEGVDLGNNNWIVQAIDNFRRRF